MKSPNQPRRPSTNQTIWRELWQRASQEPLGLAIDVDDIRISEIDLFAARPPAFADYTVCRTPDPNILFIVKPGVTLDEVTP